jgi:hypothetical protein
MPPQHRGAKAKFLFKNLFENAKIRYVLCDIGYIGAQNQLIWLWA